VGFLAPYLEDSLMTTLLDKQRSATSNVQRPDEGALDQVLSRITALAPIVARHARDIEQDRRLPAELVSAFKSARIYGMLVPRRYGGLELDAPSAFRAVSALAKLDGAVGWNAMIGHIGSLMPFLVSPALCEEIFHDGKDHIGLSTLDLDKTRAFYEGVLGFKPVVADTITIQEGGHLRHMFFDVGGGQLIAFLEPNNVPDMPAKYDAGINGGLGVPAGFYHFAFEAGSPAALAQKRDELRGKGVETTEIVDHGWARSIYFKDPNGIYLSIAASSASFRTATR
jgi:catechol 2,3-dioxygenase-like lactoylglutathione lyase family enzyme